MAEKFNHENERHGASEEILDEVRSMLRKAEEERKVLWEENSQEFIIKFPDWHREYSKRNLLKSAEAERNIGILKKNPGLHETKEDEHTYSITTFQRIVHVPKWGKVPLGEDSKNERIQDVVRAFLSNPSAGEKGEIQKTIRRSEVDKTGDLDNNIAE
ncbi:MAG: hypothetical protein AAB594_01780 [Patescibacteria group bacterium]